MITVTLVMLLFILSGIYNVSQTSEHNPLVRWALKTTQFRSVHQRAEEIAIPPLNDSSMIVSGFIHYNSMCTMCHGAPGQSPGDLASGLTPEPPLLFEEAEEEAPGELFWIIKNGIKFTSMPAFGPTHTDQDIWNIVAFLKNQKAMDAATYKAWLNKYAGGNTSEAEEVHEDHKH